MSITFSNMENWTLTELRTCRDGFRKDLIEDIQQRNSMKAEILFLQNQIMLYQSEDHKSESGKDRNRII